MDVLMKKETGMRPSYVTGLAASALVLAMAVAVFDGPAPAQTGNKQPAATTDDADKILVRFNGRYENEATEPGLFRFVGDMLSPSGERLGTQIHQAKCSTTTPPPCGVFDVEETFQFPDGSITVKTPESAAIDPQYPDHLLVGVHTQQDNIAEATGIFAGRTGRGRASGWHDLSELQQGYATFNDFWLIELNPR
ncbi:MAG: hypothetical protein M3357_19970 [Actinomycetota bacterium]|nr:hypothetical protein [Actinomycetota bacterium]